MNFVRNWWRGWWPGSRLPRVKHGTPEQMQKWMDKKRARGQTIRCGPDQNGNYWWSRNGGSWEIGP